MLAAKRQHWSTNWWKRNIAITCKDIQNNKLPLHSERVTSISMAYQHNKTIRPFSFRNWTTSQTYRRYMSTQSTQTSTQTQTRMHTPIGCTCQYSLHRVNDVFLRLSARAALVQVLVIWMQCRGRLADVIVLATQLFTATFSWHFTYNTRLASAGVALSLTSQILCSKYN